MKQTVKRALAVLLTLMIVAGIIPLGQLSLPVPTAIAADVTADKVSDIYGDLGFNFNEPPAGNETRKESNPFGSNRYRVVSVDEFFVATGFSTNLYERYFDGLGTTINNINFDSPGRGYLPETVSPQNTNGVAIAGNFTGSGRKSEIAELHPAASTVGQALKNLELNVFDAKDPVARNGKIDTAQAFTDTNGRYGPTVDNLKYRMFIETADLNGDGFDEIIVLAPGYAIDGSTAYAPPRLSVYSLKPNTGNELDNATRWLVASNWTRQDLDTESITTFELVSNYTQNSLAVGDLNYDGLADIVVTASESALASDSSGSATDGDVIAWFGSKSLNLTGRLIVNGAWHQHGTVKQTELTAVITDIDGTQGSELLLVYNTSDMMSLGVAAYSYGYAADLLVCNPENGSFAKAEKVLDFAYADVVTNSVLNLTRTIVKNGTPSRALRAAAVPLNGKDEGTYLVVNGYAHKWDEGTFTFGPMLNLSDLSAVTVQGTVTGFGSNGLATLNTMYGVFYSHTPSRAQSNGFINIRSMTPDGANYYAAQDYVDIETGDHLIEIKGKNVSRIFARSGAMYPAYFAVPDTDNDSAILEYIDYELVYDNPKVLAALASPPYFKDLTDVPGGDSYAYYSSTTFGTSKGTGTSKSESHAVTVGGFYSQSGAIGAAFLGSSAMVTTSMELTYDYTHTWESEQSNTVTTSVEYTTYGGQDSVVMTATPYDVYHYLLHTPISATETATTQYDVHLPYQPITTIVPLETYNKVYAANTSILPDIDAEVFTHELGYPGSYPKTASGFYKAIAADRFVQASGMSSVSQGLEIEQSNTNGTTDSHAVSLSVSIGAKTEEKTLGPAVEMETEIGVTAGYENTKGKYTIDTTGSSYTTLLMGMPSAVVNKPYGYSSKMLQYMYKKGDFEFPVVTYIVADVRNPALLPDDIRVERATATSITLSWLPSAEDRFPGVNSSSIYDVYRVFGGNSGGENYFQLTDEFNKLVFNNVTGRYEFTETGLAPLTECTYVLTASKSGALNSLSVYSAPVTGYTSPAAESGFSLQPASISISQGGTGALTAVLSAPDSVKTMYAWQKYYTITGGTSTWVSAAAPGITGTNTATLTFTSPAESQAGLYRLVATTTYGNGTYSSFVSSTATVKFAKLPTAITLANPVYNESRNELTLSATVTDSANSPVINGMIRFVITNNEKIKTVFKYVEDGTATITTSVSVGGLNYVTAYFDGNSLQDASASASKTFIKKLAAPEKAQFTSSFMGGTYVYGSLTPFPVQVLNIGATAPEAAALTLEYQVAIYLRGDTDAKGDYKWTQYPFEMAQLWLESGSIRFREVGSFKIVVSRTSNYYAPDATPFTRYVEVLPRISEYTVKAIPERMTRPFVTEPTLQYVNTGGYPTAQLPGGYFTLNDSTYLRMTDDYVGVYTRDENGALVQVTDFTDLAAGVYEVLWQPPGTVYDFFGRYNLTVKNSVFTVDPGTFTVGYSAGLHGGVSAPVQSGETLNEGVTLPLTAAPDAGFAVDKWIVNGAAQSASGNTLNLLMDGDKTVSVTFKQAPYKLTYSASPTVGGTLGLTVNGGNGTASGGNAYVNMPLSFIATPKPGWTFERWIITTQAALPAVYNGVLYDDGTAGYTIDMPPADLDVKAVFSQNGYVVTFPTGVLASAEGSGIRSGNNVVYGTEVLFTAPGYDIDYWTVDGEYVWAGAALTLVITKGFAVDFSGTPKNADYEVRYGSTPFGVGSVTVLIDGEITALDANEPLEKHAGTRVELVPNVTPGYVFGGWDVGSEDGGGYTLDRNNLIVDGLGWHLIVVANFEPAVQGVYTITDNAYSGNPAYYSVTADGLPVTVTYDGVSHSYSFAAPSGSDIVISETTPIGMYTFGRTTVGGVTEFEYLPREPDCYLTFAAGIDDGFVAMKVNGVAVSTVDAHYPGGSVIELTHINPQRIWQFGSPVTRLPNDGRTLRFVLLSDNRLSLDDTYVAYETFTVTIDADEHLSVSKPENFIPYPKAQGATAVGFTLTAEPGYLIKSVTSDAGSVIPKVISPDEWIVSTSNINADTTITAVSEPRRYTITSKQPEHAAISVTSAATFGDDVTVSVTPESGYGVASVSVSYVYGAEVLTLTPVKGAGDTYTFEMPGSNALVTVRTYAATPVGDVAITPPVFPRVEQGTAPSAQPITVTNTGETTIYIRQVRTNLQEKFTLLDGGPTEIAPGASKAIWSIEPRADIEIGTWPVTITAEYAEKPNGPSKTATAQLQYVVSKQSAAGVNQTVNYQSSGTALAHSYGLSTLMPSALWTADYVASVSDVAANLIIDSVTLADSGRALDISLLPNAQPGQYAIITVRFTGDTFETFTAKLSVVIVEGTKTPVTITASIGDKQFDGAAHSGYTALSVAPAGQTPAALYESTDGGGYSGVNPPTDAGSYRLTLSVDNTDFIGSVSYTFVITKRTVTARPQDVILRRGDTVDVTSLTITYSGFVAGDTGANAIATSPAISIDESGGRVVASGGTLNTTRGKNYVLAYAVGALTITEAPEQPTWTSTPGTISGGTARFVLDGEFADFVGLTLNDNAFTLTQSGAKKLLSGYPDFDGTAGEAESGSVVITLNTAFIASLPNGTYTLKITMRESGRPAPYAELESVFVISRAIPGGNPPKTTTDPTEDPPAGTVSVVIETPEGQDPVSGSNGSVTLPGGGTVTLPGGAKVDVPAGTVVDNNGLTTIPQGGTAEITTVSGKTITIPGGTTVSAAGTVTLENGTILIIDEDTPLGVFIDFENPFIDVKEDDWFYDNVAFVFTYGIMTGTSANTFSPGSNTTRAQVATVLYRLEGSPKVEGDSPFTDVAEGLWYSDAIKWAEANDIVNGVGGGRFAPDANVTREQLVTILYRYAAFKKYEVSPDGSLDAFTDAAAVSEYARDAFGWAIHVGIIQGIDDRLAPQGGATRAQIAAVLHRFAENVK